MPLEIILDCKCLQDKREAQVYLQESFGFPEWYGKNLDALHDSLTELRDIRIVLEHAEDAEKPHCYAGRIRKVLEDTAKENPYIEVLVQPEE